MACVSRPISSFCFRFSRCVRSPRAMASDTSTPRPIGRVMDRATTSASSKLIRRPTGRHADHQPLRQRRAVAAALHVGQEAAAQVHVQLVEGGQAIVDGLDGGGQFNLAGAGGGVGLQEVHELVVQRRHVDVGGLDRIVQRLVLLVRPCLQIGDPGQDVLLDGRRPLGEGLHLVVGGGQDLPAELSVQVEHRGQQVENGASPGGGGGRRGRLLYLDGVSDVLVGLVERLVDGASRTRPPCPRPCRAAAGAPCSCCSAGPAPGFGLAAVGNPPSSD